MRALGIIDRFWMIVEGASHVVAVFYDGETRKGDPEFVQSLEVMKGLAALNSGIFNGWRSVVPDDAIIAEIDPVYREYLFKFPGREESMTFMMQAEQRVSKRFSLEYRHS